MKKCTLHGVAIAAIAGFVLATHAQDSIDQSQYPTILRQPVDACVQMGTPVTFSVQATNVDSYQWYLNNAALDGQTNSSVTISAVSTNDVGYYSAAIIKGSEAVPTRLACLNAYIALTSPSTLAPTQKSGARSGFASQGLMANLDMGGGGPIVVFGFPVFGNGGSGGCPGRYSGYVNFTKTVSQGWGWTPSTNTVHIASDGNRSDTKVTFAGDYGDGGCATNAVTIPNPPMSPLYRFSIFFPQGSQVPTNAYPITLTGFNP